MSPYRCLLPWIKWREHSALFGFWNFGGWTWAAASSLLLEVICLTNRWQHGCCCVHATLKCNTFLALSYVFTIRPRTILNRGSTECHSIIGTLQQAHTFSKSKATDSIKKLRCKVSSQIQTILSWIKPQRMWCVLHLLFPSAQDVSF